MQKRLSAEPLSKVAIAVTPAEAGVTKKYPGNRRLNVYPFCGFLCVLRFLKQIREVS
jgi:hypothetical protein